MKLSTLFLLITAWAAASMADPLMWDHNGVAVFNNGFIDGDRAVAANSEGYVASAWSDVHTGNREVYAQLVGPGGEVLWGNGVQITHDAYEQSSPVITATDGGWIIAWMDYAGRPYWDPYGGDVWMQKLNIQGQPLWADGGVQVLEGSRVANASVKLCTDGNGGVMLTWALQENGGQQLYAARVSSAGQAAWPEVFVGVPVEGRFGAVADGSGGLILTWEEQIDNTNGLWASRIAPDGSSPWGVASVAPIAHPLYDLSLAADGSGGCYVAWNVLWEMDWWQIWMQRLNPAGDRQWTDNGLAEDTSRAIRSLPLVAASFSNGAPDGCLLNWTVGNGSYVSYVQKFDLAGTPRWDATGKILDDSMLTATNVDLVSDNAGGLLGVWEDWRTAYDSNLGMNLRATRLNALGGRVWSPGTVPLCAAPKDQFRPVIVRQSAGFLVQFENSTRANADTSYLAGLALQKLDPATGAQMFAPAGVTVVQRPSAILSAVYAAPMSDGRTAVLWGTDHIQYQILNSDGGFIVNSDTATIRYDSTVQTAALTSVCSDGQGGFFAAINSTSAGYIFSVLLAHMTADGHLTGDGRARPFCPVPDGYSTSDGLVSPDNAGGCYIALNVSYGDDANLSVIRVNSDCEPMWTAAVPLPEGYPMDIGDTKILTEPDGSCVVAWCWTSCDLARVSPDGTILWNRALTDSTSSAWAPKLASDGQNGVYCTWMTPWEGNRVQTQHVTADGTVLWQQNGLPATALDQVQSQSRPVLDSEGNLVVIWAVRAAQSTTTGIRMQRISPEGMREWSDSGRSVCELSGSQLNPCVVTDDADGFYVEWQQSYRSDQTSAVRATHLNSDGLSGPDPYWVQDAGGFIGDSAVVDIQSPVLVPSANGSAVAVWLQFAGQSSIPDYSIHAQRIVSNTLAAKNNSPALPARYTLHQNYPNPFNPTTLISFGLAKAGISKLTVYDLLGREVTTLVNQHLAAGEHQILFDASRLASGIYIYRLQSGRFASSRKMIVLK